MLSIISFGQQGNYCAPEQGKFPLPFERNWKCKLMKSARVTLQRNLHFNKLGQIKSGYIRVF